MSGNSAPSIGALRKQVIYRANHRGMREMDILLGGFADARVGGMDVEMLERFEKLLSIADQELFAWLTGARPAPPDADHELLEAIAAHQSERRKV